MKTLFTLLFSIILTFPSYSQLATGGPDTFGYSWINSTAPGGPSFQWFDISVIGTQVSGLADDNFVGPFSISGFPYYTTNPTQLYIGSNGFISFAGVNISSTAASFPAIPTVGGPNNFIAPFLTDLTFAGNASNPGVCYFYNVGDTICVSFEQVPFWVNNANQYGGDNSFQVILNKRDSSITFNYLKQVGNPDPVYVNNFLSIGIENPTGNDGLQYFRSNTYPADSSSVKFEFPLTVQPVTDVELKWTDNSENGGVFVSRNTNYQVTTNISNAGNQNVTNPMTVNYQLINSNGIIVNQGSSTLSSLNNGDDSTITVGASINLSTADRYNLRTFITQVSGDAIQSNDTAEVLITVLDTVSVATQFLDYTDQGTITGSISWNGGNGGVSVYIEPPYYPARVVSSNFFINVLGTAQGFHSVLYDDNGRSNSHGTVLDSTFVPAAQITLNSYYSNFLIPSNIVINNGGVYLHWLMAGDGINLGVINRGPASKRTFEVLGGAWSSYRSRDTDDFMMNIEIQPVSSVGISEYDNIQNVKLYPNPASNYVNVEADIDLSKADYELIDVRGRHVDAKIMSFNNKLVVYKSGLESGTYFLRINKRTHQIQFVD